MKIPLKRNFRQQEDGTATILFITLLTIMVLLATAESAALIRLHREVKFVEQQQIKRLDGPQAALLKRSDVHLWNIIRTDADAASPSPPSGERAGVRGRPSPSEISLPLSSMISTKQLQARSVPTALNITSPNSK